MDATRKQFIAYSLIWALLHARPPRRPSPSLTFIHDLLFLGAYIDKMVKKIRVEEEEDEEQYHVGMYSGACATQSPHSITTI